MAAADIVHEQTEQLVVDLCRQSDLMARQVENFFGRWVKLVTLPTQMTRTRMHGGVGGGGREANPYPDLRRYGRAAQCKSGTERNARPGVSPVVRAC